MTISPEGRITDVNEATTRVTGTERNRDARHLAAVTRSLQWADDAAEHGDHANAIAWLRAVEAIGDELSAAYRIKLHAWLLALGADRSKG